jgi:proteasome component ECM29
MQIWRLKCSSGCCNNRFEDLHGAVCSTGYVLAECMISKSRVPEHLLLTAIAALFEEMNSGNTTLAGSAAEAIGHAGLRAPLPLPAGDLTSVLALTAEKSSSTTVATAVTGSSKDGLTGKEAPVVAPSVSVPQLENSKEETPEAGKQEEGLSMALVVKRLASLLASKEVKLVQKAVLAFGHLCFGNRNTELSETALTALFTLSRSKAEDVLFSIGEALAFIWGGVSITADKILKSAYVSLSASSNFLTGDAPASGGDVEMSDAGNSSDDSQCDLAREKIIRKLFDELLFSSRKEERCAGSVWLLSIVSYCGRQTRVQQMLPQIQVRGPSLVSPIERHGSTRENLIEKTAHT